MAGAVCRFFARPHRVADHCTMRKERRHRRAETVTLALRYQLDACCHDGRIQAMVVADGDGLPLAAAGDAFACDEVAAHMVHVGARIAEFNGTLLDGASRWDVQMKKVTVDGSELLVCAVGGTAEQRKKQITRGAEGALRILNAA
jgi:uncharacterized Zn-binding protein involved in type VI secretion